MRQRKLWIVIGCSLVLFALLRATPSNAQVSDGRWSQPYRLSTQGVAGRDPVVVADPFGYVHVFWGEHSTVNARELSTVHYARFDGQSWSKPVDIFAFYTLSEVGSLAATVDETGTLHLAWKLGQTGAINYSSAPAWDALSANKWRQPVLINVPAYRIALQADPAGTLHLLYSLLDETARGVYYTSSHDQGASWSPRYQLDPDVPRAQAAEWLRLLLDQSGALHALWYLSDVEVGGGRSVRYAHSLDGGRAWSTPFTVEEVTVEEVVVDTSSSRVTVDPALAVDEADPASGQVLMADPALVANAESVHIIWAGHGTRTTSRKHLVSTDRGSTWQGPDEPFGDLHGQAIGDGLAVDGVGRIHFMGYIRWPRGLYHAYWDQGVWSFPSLVYLTGREAGDALGDRLNPHHTRLAVRAGNQLVATFYDRSEEHGHAVYVMHRSLDDVAPLPVSSPPTPVAGSDLTASPTPAGPAPTPTVPLPSRDVAPSLSAAADMPGAGAVWQAILPALVLIVGVGVFRLRRRF